MTTLLLTTNPGIEDLVEAELRRQGEAQGLPIGEVERRADGWPGRVRVHSTAPLKAFRDFAMELPCIHHVLTPIWEGPLPQAESVPAALAELALAQDWSAVLDATTMRGSCERHGEHDFGSPEVEAHVGGAVARLTGLGVKMKGWDVAARCDVRNDRAFMAVQYTTRSVTLSRLDRPYLPRTAIKPTIAWALWRLALADGAQPKRVLDPFMGSGSLLLEAGLHLPETELVGSDSYGRHLVGATRNLEAMDLMARTTLVTTDVRQLSENLARHGIEPGSIDIVVTNPPYGMRLGARMNFHHFYDTVLHQLHTMLRPGGRVVLMALKRHAFTEALNRHGGFTMHPIRIVETGGIFPTIFVLDRRPLPGRELTPASQS